jgi:hypothetical protein
MQRISLRITNVETEISYRGLELFMSLLHLGFTEEDPSLASKNKLEII